MPTAAAPATPAPQLLRARGRRGGPRAARDRAGHAHAGRHRADPALVHVAGRGLALSVYGAASLGPKAFEAGSRAAAARRPASASWCRCSCREAPTRSRSSPPPADPRYATLRPDAGAAPGEGTAFAGDPPCAGTRGGGPGHAPRGGQGHGDAGDRLHRRQPVPLHEPALLGGGRDQPVRPLGLARPLPRSARHRRQPAPGADARVRAPALAGRAQRARGHRGASRTTTTSDARGAGAGRDPMLDAFGELGELPTSDPGSATRGRPWRPPARLRDQLAPFQDGFTTPAGVAYPDTRASRRRLAALAAMLTAACRCRWWRSRRGGYDTHSNQALELPTTRSYGRGPAGLPARPRGARHRRPRAGARVERVRPPPGENGSGHRPRRGRRWAS